MSSIIILDSSDEESENKIPKKIKPNKMQSQKSTTESAKTKEDDSFLGKKVDGKEMATEKITEVKTKESFGEILETNKKRKLSDIQSENDATNVKRIKPTLISKNVDQKWFQTQSPMIVTDDLETENGAIIDKEKQDKKLHSSSTTTSATSSPAHCSEGEIVSKPEDTTTTTNEIVSEKDELNPVFAALLETCRQADSSVDMETLIEKKLVKYYHSVHPDFVNTKSFCRTVKSVTEDIKTTPDLVYYKLKTIVEELKIRRHSHQGVMCNEDVTTTGNERKDGQIKRLNRALYVLTKRIAKLEGSDVDLNDDDNSTYLQVERYKKRACEIYEKICDLTGESKHAYRSVKKPISFQGTCYPQFNRTIQAFVNRTNTFPDFFDVLRCLEHCNKQYCFSLKNDEIKKIAQDAFIKIGKLLQNRRKTDLYETVSHFTGSSADPALADPTLNAKLSENQKYHSKISTIIDKYAAEQELAATEKENHKKHNNETTNGEDNKQNLMITKEPPSSPCINDDKKDVGIELKPNEIIKKTSEMNGEKHNNKNDYIEDDQKIKDKIKEIVNSNLNIDTKLIKSKFEEIVISDEDEL